MRRVLYLTILAIFLLSSAIGITACGSDNGGKTPSPSPEATPTQPESTSKPETLKPSGPNEILITNKGFQPLTLTVPAGTTVTWYNVDRVRNARHWIKSKDGLFDTRVIPVEARATVTFNEKGEFEYYCVYHRDREDEQGKIIVE